MHVAQLYGAPHEILGVFFNLLEENVFQNPQTFSQAIYFSGFNKIPKQFCRAHANLCN
jgi:hypothetical protein